MHVGRRRPDRLRSALHDRLGPGLANLALRLELLEGAADGGGLTREHVAHLKHEVSGLVRELSRIVHDEPPELLEREGLVRAAAAACRQLEHPNLRVDFVVSGPPVEPSAEVADLVYRAVLEGTANVARHSGADHCRVRLAFSDSHVSLEIQDNGRGTPQGEQGAPSGGLGLVSLTRAVHRVGGKAHLESVPGAGARLVVRLPLRERIRTRVVGPRTLGPRQR